MPEIRLTGCMPIPLAHYLKALGVFRVVSQQMDSDARGCWRHDVFDLQSSLEPDDLARFLLEQYAPTPLVAPWNGGSGYYPKDTKAGIDAIAVSAAPRLQAYAATIRACQKILMGSGLNAAPKEDEKATLLTMCRNVLPDYALAWLDAAYALTAGGPKYPPLLGTGGNDGRLEFTNNFMQRLMDVMDPVTGAPTPRSADWLQSALFGVCTSGLMREKSPGQFLPGGIGGPNASASFEGESLTNPWDFVLMLEGAVVFAGNVTRRMASAGPGVLSYPFTVRTAVAGYGSAAAADARKPHHETWVPLWENPASYREVQTLFAEGRATVGQRVARDGVDFARAVRSLGVDRGISAFERFGYLQRSGKSYLAAPLGRWEVPRRASGQVGLLDEIDPWFNTLERVAGGENAPASLDRAARRIREAIMAVCRHDTAAHWQEVLMALGAAEAAMVGAPKTTADSKLSPLPALSAGWLRASDDDSSEFRLAASLASLWDESLGALRANMVPLDPKARWPSFDTARMNQPAVVWGEADLCTNLIAALQRRCLDARRLGLPALPLAGRRSARLDDLSAFIYGEVNDARLEALIWGLNAVRIPPHNFFGERLPRVPASYGLLKLTHLPFPLQTTGGDAVAIPQEPELVRLSAAGRIAEATRLAAQRLRGSGLKPATGGLHEPSRLARRITAALLFPISEESAQWLSKRLLLPSGERSLTV